MTVIRLDPSSSIRSDEERADAQREQEHRRGRRLEAREAEVDPARRAVDVLAERQHGDHDEDRDGVQQPLEAAVDLVVEQRDDDRRHEPDRHRDQLLAHVVEGRAVDVVPRREVDHRHAVHDQPGGRQDQQVVEVPDVARASRPRQSISPGPAEPCGPRRPLNSSSVHQSPRVVPVNAPLSMSNRAS